MVTLPVSSAATQSVKTVRIFRREAQVTVLGPGRRAVVWVQGCPFACKGCIVPESWDFRGGTEIAVPDLADWILSQPDLEGVTFSGGEPMAQAGALTALVDLLRSRADVGIVCYTGYALENLRRQGTREQLALLARTDLLIDGVYSEREHGDLRWRGSANQRLLPLTDRYRADVETIAAGADRSAGLEFFVGERGAFGFAGVPPQAGFRAEFEARMMALGIKVHD
jgi:anaerobic ribonucleoside-triphosphate reductase activating protein